MHAQFDVTASAGTAPKNPNLEWALYDPELQTLDQLPPSNYKICQTISLIPLPDGTVLKTGCTSALPSALPNGTGPRVNEVFVPDPAAGALWQTKLEKTSDQKAPVVTRLSDGKVLVVGGGPANSNDPFSREAWVYDPGPNAWSRRQNSVNNHNVADKGILLNDGRVLLINGRDSEVYNPGADSWTPVCAAACPPDGNKSLSGADTTGTRDTLAPAATLLPSSGRVLVAGGFRDDKGSVRETYLFEGNAFSRLPDDGSPNDRSLPRASRGAEARLLSSDKAIVAGGEGTGRDTYLFSD